MSKLDVPKFKSYEEEAAFWDNLDTADYMENDGHWFRFETDEQRAVRIAILPEVMTKLAQRARSQGVLVETLVNAWLIEHLNEAAHARQDLSD
jgi:CopG antitoxin of type II toxin-antitoxin system